MPFVCEKKSIYAKQKPDIKSSLIVTSTLILTIVNTDITTLNILKSSTIIITQINSSKTTQNVEKTNKKQSDEKTKLNKIIRLITLIVAISVCLFATIGTLIIFYFNRTNYILNFKSSFETSSSTTSTTD